jgi:hypothetical protein
MAPDESRAEMDALLTEGIRMATHFLGKSHEFYPFAVALSPDGKIKHVSTWDGNDYPASNDVLALLYQALKEGVRSGAYKAVAIVSDVKIRSRASDPPQDAVRVHIEHPGGSPVACFLPYKFEFGAIVEGEMTAERTSPLIIEN